ncbi:hypothetical protein CN213_16145 [Sinorhizobium meliloti]|uniref:hypothetical protein n=1 Tax=Rhizobium meliloti TaxID=382 RepID=UPI000FDCBEA0|nr:hypothetical protein [Sinorhizobium meliloti]RVH56277.1 hypothetical protein CN213_16145 [Sinorhizobium meliloti]
MAPHPRKLIRADMVSLLKAAIPGDPVTYPTRAGQRVFDSADSPPHEDDPPSINVYMVGEDIDPEYRHQEGQRRRIMEVRVECYYSGGDGGEIVDEMAWQVENALRANPTINNKVEWCHLINTNVFFVESKKLALFAAVMTWQVIYYTHEYIDEGGRPTIVLLGFAPEIGPGHEPDYSEILNEPEVTP